MITIYNSFIPIPTCDQFINYFRRTLHLPQFLLPRPKKNQTPNIDHTRNFDAQTATQLGARRPTGSNPSRRSNHIHVDRNNRSCDGQRLIDWQQWRKPSGTQCATGQGVAQQGEAQKVSGPTDQRRSVDRANTRGDCEFGHCRHNRIQAQGQAHTTRVQRTEPERE